MGGAFLLVVCLVGLLCVDASIEVPLRARGGDLWSKHQKRERAALAAAALADGGVAIETNALEQWITLPCDHNNPTGDTYQNKYYIDRTYTKPNNAPIFFIMGGEGPVSGIGSNYITYLAKQFQATVVAIEHRFYGVSLPYGSLETKYLHLLNVEQALLDVVTLISYLQNTSTGGPNLPVVTFGGSYSGGLSAWLRVAYPNTTMASLSSSGVVNAILNFTAFDEQVATAIGTKCANTLRAITTAFENAIAAGEGTRVKGLLKATILDDADFFFMIADAQAMAAQYGNKASLCNAMAVLPTDAESLMSGYAAWSIKTYGPNFGIDCYYDTQCLKSETARWGFARSWRWQCCDQVAYLQTAPTVGSIRSKTQSLQYMLDQCIEIFGDGVYPRTQEFNARYGADRPPTTYVYFSDFSDDPWQRASVNQTLRAELPYTLVTYDGAGHCADFHYPSVTDNAALTASRKLFQQYLTTWLA